MNAATTASLLAPIVTDLVVGCTPVAAFDYFTRDVGRWWPLATHSVDGANAKGLRFEPQVGGGLLETLGDGTDSRWGTVEVWQPGRMLRFSWHPGRDEATAQWVEIAFAEHPAGTRVTLTHGGWEPLGARGGKVRSNYVNGWATVFVEGFGGYCGRVGAG